MVRFFVLVASVVVFQSCFTGKAGFHADRKFSSRDLNRDYDLFQSVLEASHPGLYWYTSKDSMDYYFNWGRQQLTDSLKGSEFKRILTYVTAKINCGHTSVLSGSNNGLRSRDSNMTRIFPLSIKFWHDTMVVINNLNRKDSVLRRGTIITSIFGKNYTDLTDTLSRYISSDGYNATHKLQTLSSGSGFGSLYRSVFGMPRKIPITYIDSTGVENDTTILAYIPVRDSSKRVSRPATPKRTKKATRENIRNLQIDAPAHTAIMELHSFGRKYGIHSFIKKSFRTIKKQKVNHLVIDLRSNGGGSVGNSTLLSKYIRRQPFKIADSLYAQKRSSRHGALIENHIFNNLFMIFMTRKKADGFYHFGYYEKHKFRPKKKNGFDGHVYILTGGNTFSASTLFAQVVNDEENVTIVGEETGGAAYGNTAWLIPEVKLPETKLRFRLPLFRLVIDKNIPKNGRGILPDVEVLPTTNAIKNGIDYKMERALELIRQRNLEKAAGSSL